MPSTTLTRSQREAVERQVLEIVGKLVAELGGPAAGRAVAPGDSLDRDLGIGSLERVELLLRVEQVCGVRLPDAVMAEALTPRDVAIAVLAAEPSRPEVLAIAGPEPGAAGPTPESAR